ncbi:FAD-dependent pyridine nucleotide-disulfide oxidoreductase [Haladaptatus paucihalophilus DX253]|uniref:FAD-dependent pyridine nucleotide-disulfide oxidoreductase n=1 Tax=Haladaptatus paucihalophilus DX253 TaxID=797209 RepID=E7QWR7_HALPU|nr:NAD(P)/FAD-dependent oxidoreductase [Haladaptatus paucihalophilus]EFW91163.1 FAD-dependent pyridine nucleotide-disulfide oxidoreductase [Haladaptatus paucihalophilus DX253]SHL35431.1 NADH dehydrogenase [Haladaptatus paucihalophilus DX253]
MGHDIVVLGAGYAGTSAVQSLEQRFQHRDCNITWVDLHDYHLVLHEVHRVIRNPDAKHEITIPINEIKESSTNFIRGRVETIETDQQVISLDDGTEISYDYVLIALGSQTAYYGISGLSDNAHTVKSLDDALTIHDQLRDQANTASEENPAHVVVGGAGLSGIQTAGEIAALADEEGLPISVTLVEAMESIMPGHSSDLQRSVRRELEQANIDILTDDPITEAKTNQIKFASGNSVNFDLFIWTGGITGHDTMESVSIAKEHNRVQADTTFKTSDDSVFVIGDAGLINNGDGVIPPTAQAAWQAADTVAKNIERSIDGKPLETWNYSDKGTVISIGESAVAHSVPVLPIETFGSYPAQILKKMVAARWIASVTTWSRALGSWKTL